MEPFDDQIALAELRQQAPASPPTPLTRSETITNVVAALAQAQGQFEPIPRTRTVTVRTKGGDEYSYAYAPLDEVLRATVPALAKAGIAHWWDQRQRGNALRVTCYLAHGDEWLSSSLVAEVAGMEPQKVATTLTYLKRYTYQNVVGVTAEEDNDASDTVADASSTHTPRTPVPRSNGPTATPTQGRSATKPVSEKQAAFLRKLTKAAHLHEADLLAYVREQGDDKIRAVEAIPQAYMDMLLDWLRGQEATRDDRPMADNDDAF